MIPKRKATDDSLETEQPKRTRTLSQYALRDLTASMPSDMLFHQANALRIKNPLPGDDRLVLDTSNGGHFYVYDGTRLTSLSSSTLVASPFEPFDKSVSKNPSLKTNKKWTPEYYGPTELEQTWEHMGNVASECGTKFHAAIELYLNENRWARDQRIALPLISAKKFLDEFLQENDPFRTELVVSTTTHLEDGTEVRIPGCIDLVYKNKITGKYGIIDWKCSSADLTPTCTVYEKNWSKVAPFSNRTLGLPGTSRTKYSLQLCLYSIMLEHTFDIKTDIEHIMCVKFDPFTGEVYKFNPPDLRQLVRDELIANYAKYAALANTKQ